MSVRLSVIPAVSGDRRSGRATKTKFGPTYFVCLQYYNILDTGHVTLTRHSCMFFFSNSSPSGIIITDFDPEVLVEKWIWNKNICVNFFKFSSSGLIHFPFEWLTNSFGLEWWKTKKRGNVRMRADEKTVQKLWKAVNWPLSSSG